jgi:hypothetical protein
MAFRKSPNYRKRLELIGSPKLPPQISENVKRLVLVARTKQRTRNEDRVSEPRISSIISLVKGVESDPGWRDYLHPLGEQIENRAQST